MYPLMQRRISRGVLPSAVRRVMYARVRGQLLRVTNATRSSNRIPAGGTDHGNGCCVRGVRRRRGEDADRVAAGDQARERADVDDEILAGHQQRARGRVGLGRVHAIVDQFILRRAGHWPRLRIHQQVALHSITRRSRAATSIHTESKFQTEEIRSFEPIIERFEMGLFGPRYSLDPSRLTYSQ